MKFKKSIITFTTATMLMSSVPLAGFAAANNTPVNQSVTVSEEAGSHHVTLDQKTKDFLKTFTETGVMKEISEKNGKMIILNDNTNYLKSTYGLTDEYISLLRKIVFDANQKKILANSSTLYQNKVINSGYSTSAITPNLHVSDWKVYFNQSDIDLYLFTAASIGVPAFAAALNGISLILGPAGPVISTILTIAGYSGMANLCYLVIQSKYRSQNGVYFGINWNGPWPNLTQGTW
ncbi:hypothetical protein ACP26L_15640 [Paenibacillus sp. S-38]|uniref:hypothetical protein n=1 Tax=Paenibacillus sp. S-38 TaxID=3416710 RepID=UPI003CED3C79